MEQDRRDLFKKIAAFGASALALVGVSKSAKAFEGNEQQNGLLGLWDLTIPVQPAVGLPVPLVYKYAISEGGYVATGNYDADAAFNGGFTYSPTMGTYTPTTFRNSYLLRERSGSSTPAAIPRVPPISTARPLSPRTERAGPAPAPTFSTTSTVRSYSRTRILLISPANSCLKSANAAAASAGATSALNAFHRR